MPYLLFLPILLALTPLLSQAETGFVGSATCSQCHNAEYQAWRGSHHDLAMQLPAADTVLGDFNNASFVYNGITSTFFTRNDEYFVRTDGEDGKLTEYPVRYVFGVYPLQQYLLPLDRGRLQALSIAWDARPASEGGQRWYHLYPDEPIDYRDPLHWTGPYQNWNTRCAECHSTNVKKHYDATTRSFATRFDEINVGCEGCHGPGATHVELARSGSLEKLANGGLALDMAQRGEWAFGAGESIARRRQPLSSDTQIDNCGRCHSRRGTLGDYHYGADLLDTHRLSMLQSPLYYPDGQILDEVYVYGSFVQSKMHQAGVVCSNCHEPHSNQLRAPDNGVCAQCHLPQRYDVQAHHHHPVASEGALCANCHMPETSYMGVDPRRDHSMRIPRPDLSLMAGTPNACNQCHSEQSADWALAALRSWEVSFSDSARHPARAFHALNRGDGRGVPRLAELASDTSAAPIYRASALEAIGQFGASETLPIARDLLQSPDPMLRTSAVRSLQGLPIPQRYGLLQPLLDDPVATVRMEVASSLASVPLDRVSPAEAEALLELFAQYRDVQLEHADMPSVQLQLALFYSARGDFPSAEAAYREALYLNAQLVPAYLNLADLLRGLQREEEARVLLQTALEVAPDNSATLHALGLLETRAGNSDSALDLLGRAAAAETEGTRHRFVYAIALHDLGQPEEAIRQLESLNRSAPDNEEVLLALANYSAGQGQRQRAQAYAQRLVELAPSNPAYRRLLGELGR